MRYIQVRRCRAVFYFDLLYIIVKRYHNDAASDRPRPIIPYNDKISTLVARIITVCPSAKHPLCPNQKVGHLVFPRKLFNSLSEKTTKTTNIKIHERRGKNEDTCC